MTAVAKQFSSKELAIPIDSYLVLERLIASVRLHVLREAVDARGEITLAGIVGALSLFLESPPEDGLLSTPENNAESEAVHTPSQEDFLFLERRLHKLRLLVLQQAKSSADECVDSTLITRAWRETFRYNPLLRSALSPDRSQEA